MAGCNHFFKTPASILRQQCRYLLVACLSGLFLFFVSSCTKSPTDTAAAKAAMDNGFALVMTDHEAAVDHFLEAAVIYRGLDSLDAYEASLRKASDSLDQNADALAATVRLFKDVNFYEGGFQQKSAPLASVYKLLAYYLKRGENYLQALDAHKRAYELEPDSLQQQNILPVVAYAQNLVRLGSDREAIALLNKAAKLLENPQYEDKEHGVNLYIDLAAAYWDLGPEYISEGLDAIQQGREYLKYVGTDARPFFSTSLAINEASLHLLADNYQDAQIALNKIDTPDQPADGDWNSYTGQVISAKRAAQADIFRAKGNFKSAANLLRTEVDRHINQDETGIVNRPLAKLQLQLAETYIAAKNNTEAENILKNALVALLPDYDATSNALPQKASLYAENTFTDIFHQLGNIYFKKYASSQNAADLKYALAAYDRMNWVEKSILDRLSYSHAQLQRLAQHLPGRRAHLNALHRAIQDGQKVAPETFQTLIESRAYVLQRDLDILHQLSASELNKNRAVLDRYYELTDEIEIIRRQLREEQFSDKEFEQLVKKEAQLYANRTATSEVIDQLYPGINWTPRDATVSMADYQKSLKKSDLSLFFLADEVAQYYLLAVSKNKQDFQKIQLNNNQLDAFVQLLSATDRAKADRDREAHAQFVSLSSDLYQAIFNQLSLKPTDFEHIQIFADGKLNRLPFEALLSHPIDTANAYDTASGLLKYDLPFLGKNRQLTYSHGLMANKSKASNEGQPLALLPAYTCCNFENLPAAQDIEQKMVQQKGQVLSNSALTASGDLIQQLSTASEALYYGHFQADTIQPLNGFFALSCISGSCDDFAWPLRKLLEGEWLPLNYFFVAGCQSGRGNTIAGEGIDNLERLLLGKGVKNVMAANWEIDRNATTLLVKYFLEQRQKTESVSEAFHLAKTNLIDKHPYYAHPHYWTGIRLATVGR